MLNRLEKVLLIACLVSVAALSSVVVAMLLQYRALRSIYNEVAMAMVITRTGSLEPAKMLELRRAIEDSEPRWMSGMPEKVRNVDIGIVRDSSGTWRVSR